MISISKVGHHKSSQIKQKIRYFTVRTMSRSPVNHFSIRMTGSGKHRNGLSMLETVHLPWYFIAVFSFLFAMRVTTMFFFHLLSITNVGLPWANCETPNNSTRVKCSGGKRAIIFYNQAVTFFQAIFFLPGISPAIYSKEMESMWLSPVQMLTQPIAKSAASTLFMIVRRLILGNVLRT